MSHKQASSHLQEVIEAVEALPPDDQAVLIHVIRQRLIEWRRTELAREIAETREAYKRGDVRRGTAADLLAELTE